MYAKHWTKLAWTTFLENSAIFLVQQLCGALMNNWLLEYATVFSIKNKFQPIFFTFDFDLSPPPTHTHTHTHTPNLLSKQIRFFSAFIPVLSESRHYFNYLLPLEVCTNL